MPTVILLDVSLSMSRNVCVGEQREQWQRRQLAVHGVNVLLDKIASTNKMEFVSLVIFSSLYQQAVPFTRDLELVKTALQNIGEYDKTNVLSALNALNTLVLEEWGAMIPCQHLSQIILITDGSTGIGPTSLHNRLQEYSKLDPTEAPSVLKPSDFPLPFRFSGSLHVMCIGSSQEQSVQNALPLYQRLIDINDNGGEIFVPDGVLSLHSVEGIFRKLSDKYYRQFKATLRCGHLQSHVILYPPPEPVKMPEGSEEEESTMNQTIDILGFMATADVSSPAVIAKHLVLPLTLSGHIKTGLHVCFTEPAPECTELNEEDKDEGQRVSFTVLLHGSLKVEGMVAIVRIGEDWFGMLYSWADSKKKSNLMFSPFQPGSEHIPWLGSLSHLSPICDFNDPPYGQDESKSPFPVKQERRSYAQNSTVWIKAPGLQADAQKILRHARKLPDKQQHFYKELNRLRRMALSLGFMELLTAMAVMLDRECNLLPSNAHPDAALQLSHAAKLLQSPTAREFNTNIMPLRTDG